MSYWSGDPFIEELRRAEEERQKRYEEQARADEERMQRFREEQQERREEEQRRREKFERALFSDDEYEEGCGYYYSKPQAKVKEPFEETGFTYVTSLLFLLIFRLVVVVVWGIACERFANFVYGYYFLIPMIIVAMCWYWYGTDTPIPLKSTKPVTVLGKEVNQKKDIVIREIIVHVFLLCLYAKTGWETTKALYSIIPLMAYLAGYMFGYKKNLKEKE